MNQVKKVISPREAGRILGRGTATIEQGLRDRTFPVGTCFKTKAGRFVYIIPEDAFNRFLRGEIAGRTNSSFRN